MFYPAATKASLPTGPTDAIHRHLHCSQPHWKPLNIHQDALVTSASHLTAAAQQTADTATSWLTDPSTSGWAPLHPPPSSWRLVFLRAVSHTVHSWLCCHPRLQHCEKLRMTQPSRGWLTMMRHYTGRRSKHCQSGAITATSTSRTKTKEVIFDTDDHAALISNNHWWSGAGHNL